MPSHAETPDLLLAGGDVLLHDGEWRVERADVTVRDGRIQAVGLTAGRADRKPTPVSVRDCSGCLIIPGLIQAHIHLCQTLFRGLADDLPLEQWLARRIWPLEAAHTEDSVYWSAMLGAAELLLGGTTAILDMETVRHTGAAFRALETIGLRARDVHGIQMLGCHSNVAHVFNDRPGLRDIVAYLVTHAQQPWADQIQV